MGYSNNNFVRNSGTSFYLLIIWACGALVTLLLMKWKKAESLMGRITRNFIRTFFFSFLIRTVLETYLDLLISAFLNVKTLNFRTDGEIFSSVISLIILVLLLLAPFGAYFLLHKAKLKRI